MKHHVFVYGSLKKNHFNNDLLAESKLIDEGSMVDSSYSLYSLGAFPGVVKEILGTGVKGEVYIVNDETLEDLDILEGHPTFYKREKKDIKLDNDITVSCYVYIYQGKVKSRNKINSGIWENY